MVGLGYGLGQRAVDAVLLVDRYATLVSLALIGSAAVPPLVRWLATRARGAGARRGR